MNFCPKWLFDACCGSATSEYLGSDLNIELIGKKYSLVLSEHYDGVEISDMTAPVERMVLFLNEINAGENAADNALGFCYFRTTYEKANQERKIKSMFGSQLEGDKEKEYSTENVLKSFKAYIYAFRHEQVPGVPSNWTIRDVVEIELYKKLSERGASVLDLL